MSGMYGEQAELYDLIYHWKDYPADAARVRDLLSAEGVPEGASLLEAACGTGSYLAELRRWYRVAGFDASDDMLAIAQRKLPGVTLWRADMADFRPPAGSAPVDALVCAFSSIGYLVSDAQLAGAAERFLAALRPGGVLLVEAWLAPEDVDPGRPSLHAYETDDLKVCRVSRISVQGRLARVHMDWLVGRRGLETEHFREVHETALRTPEELCGAFAAVGFRVRFDPEGRGTVIGRRP